MKQVADENMVKNAVGDDEFEELSEPAHVEYDKKNPLSKDIVKVLREIYDPEIPVNIYELGLIYMIDIRPEKDGVSDVYIRMTLTSPGCPVAQEMPIWVRDAVFPLDGVGQVDVDIVWDPIWDPSMMAETAKLQLNMFIQVL